MLKTFTKGGVHPSENKITSHEAIIDFPVPAKVNIPLSMHLGAPAKPVVEKGSTIKTGQLLAVGNGFISANIHSSVSGKVNKIDSVIDTTGYKHPAVFIDVEDDEWIETIDRSSEIVTEITLSPEEITKRCLDSGIVGLGGATFPSHVKLNTSGGTKNPDLLLVNGVECEPYLTADHRLMLEKPDEIIVGINVLKVALGFKKAVIGIENNKKDAIKILKKAAKKFDYIEVIPLKVKYPQGGEKQLIKAVTGREVPNGKFPLDIGDVVYNVGTVFAIYEAIQKNKPLIQRVVTVTGKSLVKPSNFWVRIGTPIQHLLDEVGGIPDDTGKIINGGPMMGKALKDFTIPVTKGTSGLLLLPHKTSLRKDVKACIRCSKCIDVCPMGLEPHLLMNLTEKVMIESAAEEKISICIECGSCSYICPSGRPLLDYIRLGKSAVNKLKSSNNG